MILKFTWDQDNGVLLVEHQLLVGSPTLTVTMLDPSERVYRRLASWLQQLQGEIQKARWLLPLYPLPWVSISIAVDLGSRKQPKGKLLVHLGQVQVNCDHFSHPQGNVWSLGLMEN